jgi:hypothetical protein
VILSHYFAILAAGVLLILGNVATVNLDPGWPVPPKNAEMVRARFDGFRADLVKIFLSYMVAILMTIFAKAVGLSMIGHAWFLKKLMICLTGSFIVIALHKSLMIVRLHAQLHSYRDFIFLVRHGAWPRTKSTTSNSDAEGQ